MTSIYFTRDLHKQSLTLSLPPQSTTFHASHSVFAKQYNPPLSSQPTQRFPILPICPPIPPTPITMGGPYCTPPLTPVHPGIGGAPLTAGITTVPDGGGYVAPFVLVWGVMVDGSGRMKYPGGRPGMVAALNGMRTGCDG